MNPKITKILSGAAVSALLLTTMLSIIQGPALATSTSPLEVKPNPTRTYLDEVSTSNPIRVVNVTPQGTVYLCGPKNNTIGDCKTNGTSRQAASDGVASFSSGVIFNQVGKWRLVDGAIPTGDSTTFSSAEADSTLKKFIANITVRPQPLGIVSLDPSGTLGYTKGLIKTISGQVIFNSTGSPVNGTKTGAKVKLFFPDGSSVTSGVISADGRFSFPDVALGSKGAGRYKLQAFIDTNGDGDPEGLGNVTFSVSPNALRSSLSTDPAQKAPVWGFNDRDKVFLNFTYPEDGGTVGFTSQGKTSAGGPCTLAKYCVNVTVIAPGGEKVWLDDARSFGLGAGARKLDITVTGNQIVIASAKDGSTPAWTASVLGTGDYQVFVRWNTAGGFGALGEFEYNNSAPYTFTISKAGLVNAVITLAESNVKNRDFAAVPPEKGSPGRVTLGIQIYGQSQTEYPGTGSVCGTSGECPKAYLNVTGALLNVPGKDSWPVVLDGSSGSYTIPIVLSSGSSPLHVSVKWRGQEVTKDFTTGNKSLSVSTDVPSVTVDTQGRVTITVRDSFGNLIPNANVTLFWLNNPTVLTCTTGVSPPYCNLTFLRGTGEPGRGQNGQYTFTVTQSVIGTVGVIARDKESLTGIDRFGYGSFSVIRAHDLNVRLNVTRATTGVPTEIVVNVTGANGKAVGGASVYLFTRAKYDEFAPLFAADPNLDPAPSSLTGAIPASTKVGEYKITKTSAPMASGLANGTYVVFVKNATHDNVGREPTLDVVDPTITFSPNRISSQFLPNTRVDVTVTDASGQPLGGLLRFEFAHMLAMCGPDKVGCTYGAEAGLAKFWGLNFTTSGIPGGFTPADPANATGESLPATVKSAYILVNAQGRAAFYATGTLPGTINTSFAPSAQTTPKMYENPAKLRVIGPTVVITPTKIPQGVPSTLTLSVKDLNGNPLSGLYVAVCGTPLATQTGCTDALQTDSQGQVFGLGVTPSATGVLRVHVAQNAAGATDPAKRAKNATDATVVVFSGMQVSTSPGAPQVGDTVTIQVTKIAAGTPPISGARVVVTDPSGSAVLNQTTGPTGQVTLVVSTPGAYLVHVTMTGFDPADATFTVSPRTPVHIPAPHITGTGLRANPSSVVLGQATQIVVDLRNSGDADGEAELILKVDGVGAEVKRFPVRGNNGTASVGFTFTPIQAKTYSVTVSVDGVDLTPISVVVTSPTPTTPTAPPTPTPTPPATTTPSPPVPGFEVVALLAGVAASLLLLRRRS